MLVLAYGFAILDRVGLGLLVQPIEASLHITDAQMGLLQGAAFAILYAILGLPMGMVADRTDRRLLIAMGIAIWSIATIACGLAGSFVGLFVARIFAGTSMIGDWFPPASRPRAFGIYALGTVLGAGGAFLLTGTILHVADAIVQRGPAIFAGLQPWQMVFVLFGVPGVILAPFFAATVREPLRREGPRASGRISLAPLLACIAERRQVYLAMVVAGTATSICIYALFGWFPTFLIRVYGWTPAFAAQTIGLYGLPLGAISCIGSGAVVAAVQRYRPADAPIVVGIFSFGFIALGGTLIGLSTSGTVAMIGYMILSLSLNVPIIGLLTVTSRITPNALRAQMMAVLGLVGSLTSQILGPFTVGLLSDKVFGRQGVGLSLMLVVITVSAIAMATLIWARKSYAAVIGEIDAAPPEKPVLTRAAA
jgi:MFS family permease